MSSKTIDKNNQPLTSGEFYEALGFIKGKFSEIDQRFEQIDQGFESLEAKMDVGFFKLNNRIDSLERKIDKNLDDIWVKIYNLEKTEKAK